MAETFYFTFPEDHQFSKKFVEVLADSRREARNIMSSHFGNQWWGCYTEEEWITDNVTVADYRDLKFLTALTAQDNFGVDYKVIWEKLEEEIQTRIDKLYNAKVNAENQAFPKRLIRFDAKIEALQDLSLAMEAMFLEAQILE